MACVAEFHLEITFLNEKLRKEVVIMRHWGDGLGVVDTLHTIEVSGRGGDCRG